MPSQFDRAFGFLLVSSVWVKLISSLAMKCAVLTEQRRGKAEDSVTEES